MFTSESTVFFTLTGRVELMGGEVFDQNFECLAMQGRWVVVGSTLGPGEQSSHSGNSGSTPT